jgi:hypothetical protein
MEWERCIELQPMLDFLWNKLSGRKFQLFAVACCHQHWDLFTPQPGRQIVNAAEQFADEIGTQDELEAVINVPAGPIPKELHHAAAFYTHEAAAHTARCQSGSPWSRAGSAAQRILQAVSRQRNLYEDEYSRDPHPEQYKQIALLYDIAGNPFRPTVIDPSWRTSTVLALARRMYRAREFSAMPILADALQDAGCENADTLNHCRDSQLTHVRGCWLVDLILGKT